MRMYVIVRKDLPPSYRAVQAGHALAEYLLRNPDTQVKWNNGTLIYLNVENESELEKWLWKIERRNIDYATFREPDIDNQLTAIAAVTDTKLFSKLKLL